MGQFSHRIQLSDFPGGPTRDFRPSKFAVLKGIGGLHRTMYVLEETSLHISVKLKLFRVKRINSLVIISFTTVSVTIGENVEVSVLYYIS